MFERYTDKARRVIFFSRYEASQFGATQIETEHILLAIAREDVELVKRFFPSALGGVESIRREIKARIISRSPVPSNLDLPLSEESKRILAFAAEEAERLQHRHIGTEHLFLGLLREERSLASELLHEKGIRLDAVREGLMKEPIAGTTVTQKLMEGETQPQDRDEKWMQEVSKACFDLNLCGPDDLMDELQRVVALRQFRADVEALLRLLAAKGVADPQILPALVVELRDENKLAEFIERLRGK